ncbi:MAG: spiro-SPASM protein [Spirochaetes bacterium]|nr:spiro-SPASM protein [Spirochaetota bacterium]
MKDIVLLHVDDTIENDIVFKGYDVVDDILSKLKKHEFSSNSVISVSSGYSGKYASYPDLFRRSNCDVSDWKNIFKKYEADNIIKIYADSPFSDMNIISEMVDIHKKYLAEFTFSENLPQGFSCVIVSRELADSIPESGENMLPLEKVVKSNINQFDVELFYKGPDVRDKRLNFRISDKREKLILENLYSLENRVPAYEDVKRLIESNPEVLYIAPSYYEIELTCRAEITSLYSYRPIVESGRKDMESACFRKILSGAENSGTAYSICLGGSGDPLLHPAFYEYVETALESVLLEKLIIETDGLLCDESFITFLQKKNDNRIHVILDCSGYDNETYKLIHGADLFEKVHSNIELLKNHFGDDSSRFYIQILKINETENYLDKYYDYWMKKKVSIILQKQNTYLGKIEDRRYYDLSPVVRTPCWHLQRDLYILSDGTAAFCKEDVNGEWSDFNIPAHTVQEIWNSKKEFFINDYRKNLCKNPDCSKCDEWYTFNF